MNAKIKAGIIEYINMLLLLKSWEDINTPITPQKMNGKFQSKSLFSYLPKEEKRNINSQKNSKMDSLIDILLSYDRAIEDDWLPDEILNLSIPKAYLFLKKIKTILESNIAEEVIENEIRKCYHKIKEKP